MNTSKVYSVVVYQSSNLPNQCRLFCFTPMDPLVLLLIYVYFWDDVVVDDAFADRRYLKTINNMSRLWLSVVLNLLVATDADADDVFDSPTSRSNSLGIIFEGNSNILRPSGYNLINDWIVDDDKG